MTTEAERGYVEGSRRAWMNVLLHAAKQLGVEDPLSKTAYLIAEREEAKQALRAICAKYGDNEWDESLHLRDIIEEHLGAHLAPASQDVGTERVVARLHLLASKAPSTISGVAEHIELAGLALVHSLATPQRLAASLDSYASAARIAAHGLPAGDTRERLLLGAGFLSDAASALTALSMPTPKP